MKKPYRFQDILQIVALSGTIMALGLGLLTLLESQAERWLAGWGLLVCAGLLAWRLHGRVSWLHRRAQYHADSAAEAERHYFDVLRRIVQVVDARDPYTAGRNERIGRMCRQIATRMGFSSDRAALMGMVAQVHDIGMLAVPEGVLQKIRALRSEEFHSVQAHPQVGHDVLRPLSFLAEVLPAVRSHHERLNGTGYPDRLAGQQIPLEAQILAVAEAFEALTHDRPHRRALSATQAVNELIRCEGTAYRRDCVTALAEEVGAAELLPIEWRLDAPAESAVLEPAAAI